MGADCCGNATDKELKEYQEKMEIKEAKLAPFP